ncbi:MAG TPA: glycosyltransferase, partial [Steroidobacteraceae bacterium]
VTPASAREASAEPPRCGVVAIGRNEGERLRRCLESVRGQVAAVVYVDSGSVDGSPELARALGAIVVALDMSRPFTAARARNAGFHRLRQAAPEVEVAQFVDGDCEIREGWLACALAFLKAHADAAAVCGRNRERFPERSLYNRLCDMEWDTPVGEAKACGGNVMIRCAAFDEAGGFNEALIAGEEPELCLRLRRARWRIWRLDAEMTLHDAAMTRFGQWWRRMQRAGYAFAEGAFMHGSGPERHWVREARSATFWGLAIPLLTLALVIVVGPLGAGLLLVYPLQVLRLAARASGRPADRLLQACFIVLGKFAEALGQLRFLRLHLAGRRASLIEYK